MRVCPRARPRPFPSQREFIGGDNAVIIQGVDSREAGAAHYSTVHGAGRLFSHSEDTELLRARR